MFENIQQKFNGMFGPIESGMCKLTMNGNIAVKCSNGYKAYDVKKGTLTNVSNFCFSMDELFFVIPTVKAAVGDIILVGGRPKCVTHVDKKVITVIDYENSEIRQVVPERHVFMGSTYFYGKIVSMFGNTFSKGKGMSSIIKIMMLSSMMGGNNSANPANGMMGNMGQMMAMSMLMGGKDNSFDSMFDFSFGGEEDADDETEETKEPESKEE